MEPSETLILAYSTSRLPDVPRRSHCAEEQSMVALYIVYNRKGKPSHTSYCVLSIPIRKRSSVMKRLMQRFLWMVLRSVCNPRRKQKVDMQMAKQTREITMPTHVMTDSKSSLMRPWYWKEKRKKPDVCVWFPYPLSRMLYFILNLVISTMVSTIG